MKSHHLVARECCKVSTIKFNFPRKKIYVSKRNRRDTGEKIVETSHQKALLFTYFLLFIFFPKGNILTEGLQKKPAFNYSKNSVILYSKSKRMLSICLFVCFGGDFKV